MSTRVEKKRKKNRDEILSAAREQLEAAGIDGVTLASVANELGLTKQAIYHYFNSKEALIRALVTLCIDEEINALVEAVEKTRDDEKVLGAMIRAFCTHYAARLAPFRLAYCQSQLFGKTLMSVDEETVRSEIHPRTRQLFDLLESRLVAAAGNGRQRTRLRRLAFTAWTSALGLVTMFGVADAINDPLAHPSRTLVETIANVFDAEAHRLLH